MSKTAFESPKMFVDSNLFRNVDNKSGQFRSVEARVGNLPFRLFDQSMFGSEGSRYADQVGADTPRFLETSR